MRHIHRFDVAAERLLNASSLIVGIMVMHRDTKALTGIRGVAALWVVIVHFFGDYAGTPALHLVGKGYLAVDLFFVLSGFVLALNHGAAFASAPSGLRLAFYRRRIARVYPLFLVVMLLTLAQRVTAGAAMPPLFDVASNLSLTQAWFGRDGIVGQGWSVSVEALVYVVFPSIAVLAFRASAQGLVMAILVACAGLWGLVACGASTAVEMSPGGPLDIHNGAIFPIVRGLCGFVAGVCACRLASFPEARAVLSSRGLPEALVAAIVALAWLTDRDVVIVALFVPLVASLVVPDHPVSRVLASRFAMWLGALSYALYLIHMLAGSMIRDALLGSMPTVYVLSACTVGSLAAAVVLHELVERPAHAFFRRRAGRERSRPSAAPDFAAASSGERCGPACPQAAG